MPKARRCLARNGGRAATTGRTEFDRIRGGGEPAIQRLYEGHHVASFAATPASASHGREDTPLDPWRQLHAAVESGCRESDSRLRHGLSASAKGNERRHRSVRGRGG